MDQWAAFSVLYCSQRRPPWAYLLKKGTRGDGRLQARVVAQRSAGGERAVNIVWVSDA